MSEKERSAANVASASALGQAMSNSSSGGKGSTAVSVLFGFVLFVILVISILSFMNTKKTNDTISSVNSTIQGIKIPFSKCQTCVDKIEQLTKQIGSGGTGATLGASNCPACPACPDSSLGSSPSKRGDASFSDILDELNKKYQQGTLPHQSSLAREVQYILGSTKFWRLQNDNTYGVFRQYRLDNTEFNLDQDQNHSLQSDGVTMIRKDWIIYWSSRDNQWLIDEYRGDNLQYVRVKSKH